MAPRALRPGRAWGWSCPSPAPAPPLPRPAGGCPTTHGHRAPTGTGSCPRGAASPRAVNKESARRHTLPRRTARRPPPLLSFHMTKPLNSPQSERQMKRVY